MNFHLKLFKHFAFYSTVYPYELRDIQEETVIEPAIFCELNIDVFC
jgi:hypothetical protein